MVTPIYERTKWKYLVDAISIIMLVSVTTELVFGQVIERFISSFVMDATEFIFVTVLIFDLGLRFIDAKNRYSFIRSNSLKIIAVLPFTLFFKVARLIQIQKVAMMRTGEWFLGVITWDEFILLMKSRLFTAFRLRF